jgi:hypothetical protein
VVSWEADDDINELPPADQKRYRKWKRWISGGRKRPRKPVKSRGQPERAERRQRKMALLLQRQKERRRRLAERAKARAEYLAWLRAHHRRQVGTAPLSGEDGKEGETRHRAGSLAGLSEGQGLQGSSNALAGLAGLQRKIGRARRRRR